MCVGLPPGICELCTAHHQSLHVLRESQRTSSLWLGLSTSLKRVAAFAAKFAVCRHGTGACMPRCLEGWDTDDTEGTEIGKTVEGEFRSCP